MIANVILSLLLSLLHPDALPRDPVRAATLLSAFHHPITPGPFVLLITSYLSLFSLNTRPRGTFLGPSPSNTSLLESRLSLLDLLLPCHRRRLLRAPSARARSSSSG